MDETVDTVVGVSVAAAALMTPPTLRPRNLPFQFVVDVFVCFFFSLKTISWPPQCAAIFRVIFFLLAPPAGKKILFLKNLGKTPREWMRIACSHPYLTAPNAIWRRKKNQWKNFLYLIKRAAESNQQLMSTPSVGRQKVQRRRATGEWTHLFFCWNFFENSKRKSPERERNNFLKWITQQRHWRGERVQQCVQGRTKTVLIVRADVRKSCVLLTTGTRAALCTGLANGPQLATAAVHRILISRAVRISSIYRTAVSAISWPISQLK